MRFMKLVNSFAGLLMCCLMSLQAQAEVNWQPWSQDTFSRAEAESKMILINVGMEGCTACNRMEALTYSHSEVISLLNEHFVSIAVDSQARPDIGERYSDWAWPATAFLMPDGTQVFAMAGNRLPRNFIPILNDLITKQANNTLRPDPRSPYAAPPEPVTSPLTMLRDRLRGQIDRRLNLHTGGWNNWGVNAEVDGARLEHLYLRAHLLKDDSLQTAALKVSETFLKTLDPVWGGAYEANIAPGAPDVPGEFARLGAIPEKRISSQANAIRAFARAYRLSGDTRYRAGMQNVDRFLDEWMLSPAGTWYANQKDIPPGLPADWWPADYWLLDSDAERRRYGVPPVDHAVYTDKNAEIIIAYVHAYEAFGEQAYLNKARRAADSLLQSHLTEAGWLQQSITTDAVNADARIRPHSELEVPFLSSQARFGQALLALYQITAENRWLKHAESVADAMLSHLYDPEHGGFWGIPVSDQEPVKPRKPLEDNAVAGQFFYDLQVLTRLPWLTQVAEKTLRAVASDQVLNREGKATGETALLLEKLTAEYVEFTVVTNNAADHRSLALYQSGLAQYHPRKVIHYEAPGRYPDLGEPVMFICNPNRCSLPLKTAAEVRRVAATY